MLADCSRARMQQQIARRVQLQPVNTAEIERDQLRVGTGGYHEVVLELATITVVHSVDSGVHLAVAHFSVRSYPRAPLLGIISGDIVQSTRPLVQAGDLRARIRAHERHPHDRALRRFALGSGTGK